MSQRGERDGKGAEGSRLWQAETERNGKILMQANRLASSMSRHDMYIQQIKFVSKDDEGNDWLVVCTIDSTDGPMIGFHGASSFGEGLAGLINRIGNGTMKWKPDDYRRNNTTR